MAGAWAMLRCSELGVGGGFLAVAVSRAESGMGGGVVF